MGNIDLGGELPEWENLSDADRRDIEAQYLGYIDYLDMKLQMDLETEGPKAPLRFPKTTGGANGGRAA